MSCLICIRSGGETEGRVDLERNRRGLTLPLSFWFTHPSSTRTMLMNMVKSDLAKHKEKWTGPNGWSFLASLPSLPSLSLPSLFPLYPIILHSSSHSHPILFLPSFPSLEAQEPDVASKLLVYPSQQRNTNSTRPASP